MCLDLRGSSGAVTRLMDDLLSCLRMDGLSWGYPRLVANFRKNITLRESLDKATYSDSHGLTEMLAGSALEYAKNGALSNPTLMMCALWLLPSVVWHACDESDEPVMVTPDGKWE